MAEPTDDPAPEIASQVKEGVLGDLVPEVVGPPSLHRVEPVDEDGERLVRRPLGRCFTLAFTEASAALKGVGVHVVLRHASLLVPLDAELPGSPGALLRRGRSEPDVPAFQASDSSKPHGRRGFC